MFRFLGHEIKEDHSAKRTQEEINKLTAKIMSYDPSVASIAIKSRVCKDWQRIAGDKFPINLVHKTFPFKTEKLDEELKEVVRLSGGGTNTTSRILTTKGYRIARCAGAGSETFLSRKAELMSLQIIAELNLAPKVIYADEKGNMISEFLENAEPITADMLMHDDDVLKKVVTAFCDLHESEKKLAMDVDIFERNDQMEAHIQVCGQVLSSRFDHMKNECAELRKIFAELQIENVACHVDAGPGNCLLYGKRQVKLIDLEYCGNNDRMWDIVAYSVEGKFSSALDQKFLHAYFKCLAEKGKKLNPSAEKEARQRFVVYKAVYYFWAVVWAEVQLANKNHAFTLKELHDMIELRSKQFNEYVQTPGYKAACTGLREAVKEKNISSLNKMKM